MNHVGDVSRDVNERKGLVEWDEEKAGDESNTAFSRYMEDAMFLIPTPQVLQKIVTGLEDLYENDIVDLDMQGDLYEYMLGKLSTAGQNGQFRTPRHIINMMVELIEPTPEDLSVTLPAGHLDFWYPPTKEIIAELDRLEGQIYTEIIDSLIMACYLMAIKVLPIDG